MIENFRKLIEGSLSGFFRNIVSFNIEYVRGTHIEVKVKSLNKKKTEEDFFVKKNGKLIQKSINNEKNKLDCNIIRKAMDKNNTKNMFKAMQEQEQVFNGISSGMTNA